MIADSLTVYHKQYPFQKFLTILVIVLFAIGTGVVLSMHANKHKTADAVRNCNDDKINLILKNPLINKTATFCDLGNGFWGVMIKSEEKELTSFSGKPRDLLKYFVNQKFLELKFVNPAYLSVVAEILESIGQ